MAKSNKASAGKAQTASKGGAKGSGDNIDKMFEALGVSGSVASSGAAKGFDVEELFDRARSYVNTQLDSAKSYVAANPKAVYGTLASVVVGAGLLTAAAINKKKAAAKKGASKSSAKSSAKGSSKKSTPAKSGAKKSSAKKSSSKSSR